MSNSLYITSSHRTRLLNSGPDQDLWLIAAVILHMASVKVVVIGAAGLLGKTFARRLAALSELFVSPDAALPITQVVLFDLDVSCLQQDPLVRDRSGWSVQQGDLTDRQALRSLVAPSDEEQRIVVFLFAAVLSGNAENNFELGLEVNLRAPLALLEELKAIGERGGWAPTLVYTSTDYVACFNDTNRTKPFSEEGFRLSPTSYGIQKACVELLVCDFARRGFVDGRVGRVSAMIGRPGFSNSVSSAFSMIFTQPLIGKDYEVRFFKRLLFCKDNSHLRKHQDTVQHRN